MYSKNTKRYRRSSRLRKKTKKYTNNKKKVHFGGGCGASSASTIQPRQRVYEDELTEIKQLKSKNKNTRKSISLHKAICGGFNFMYDFNRNLIVYKPYSSTRVVPFLRKMFVISNNYDCEIGLENYDQLRNAPDTLKRDYESLIGKILFQNQVDKKGSIESELASIHYDMISLPDGSLLVVDSLGLISSIHPSCAHVTKGISPEHVNVFCKHVVMKPHKYPMYDRTMHRDYGMLTIEDIHTIISSKIHRGQPSHGHADDGGDPGDAGDSDSDSGMRELVSRRDGP